MHKVVWLCVLIVKLSVVIPNVVAPRYPGQVIEERSDEQDDEEEHDDGHGRGHHRLRTGRLLVSKL